MRLLILAAALALPASAASAPAPAGGMPVINPGPSAADECPPTSRFHAARRAGAERPEARKLTDLPAADMYMSVYRRIGRCEAPIIVRYGLGTGLGEQPSR